MEITECFGLMILERLRGHLNISEWFLGGAERHNHQLLIWYQHHV